ncbi:hypothetical protein pb186bvf_000424 [Paramecium bursaria]
MSEKYEMLIEENTQLKKALLASKAVIERKLNDLETQQSINDDLKKQIEQGRLELHDMANKIRILAHEKKQIEQQFDNTTRNWKLLTEQKQREIEEIQARLAPSFDQDMMRIKVINELEIPHRQQLEAKQNEIEKLNEQIYQKKREIDLGSIRIEQILQDNKKEIQIILDRHLVEKDDLNYQIIELQKIIEDNKDKELIKRIRKDLDDYKQKYTAVDNENEELRAERDKIREEKNELMIKFSRQIDQERNDKRAYKTEADKLNVKTRFLEDELRKEKIRREQQVGDFEITKSEKDQLLNEIRKKDDTIHYLQRKITEMEEDSLEQEQRVQDKLTRLYHEEHDKYLQERNKAVTASKDLDNLKKRFSDLTDDYKILKDRYLKENQESRDFTRQSNDETDKLKKTVSQMQKEINDLERSNKTREEQLHDLETENETLKRRNRELTHRIQLFELNPIPQPISQDNYETKAVNNLIKSQIKSAQKQQKVSQPIESKQYTEEDIAEKENVASKQSLQHIAEENRNLTKKVKKLQQKLDIANQKITQLQIQNRYYEKQLNKEVDNYQIPKIESAVAPPQFGNTTNQFGTGNKPTTPIREQRYQQPQSSQFQTNYPQQQSSYPQQQSNYQQSNYPQQSSIHDDDLLNKVMMLTQAGQQKQFW